MSKRSKMILSLLLCVLLAAACSAAAFAWDESDPPTNGWYDDVDGCVRYYRDGRAVVGEQQIDGKWYYFEPLELSLVTNEVIPCGDLVLVAHEDGVLYENEWYTNSKGNSFYLGADRRSVTGEQQIDGKWYYFDMYGYMMRGWTWYYGKLYIGHDDGVLYENEWYTSDSGKSYYLGPERKAVSGEQQIDGKWYYFNKDYDLFTDGIKNLDGKIDAASTIAAHEDGVLYENEWYEKDGTVKYFGADRRAVSGEQQIDGKWYFYGTRGTLYAQRRGHADGETFAAHEDGVLYENEWYTEDGESYYFGANRRALTGEQQIDGKWYYFDPKSGVRLTDGKKTVAGKLLAAHADGVLYENEWYNDGKNISYFAADRRALTGEQQVDGKWYYFDASALLVKDRMTQLGKSSIASHDDGVLYENEWFTERGRSYYFGADRRAVSGWLQLDEDRYYLGENGALRDEWLWLEEVWYYFKEDGVMAADEWIGTYYFDASGAWVPGAAEPGSGTWMRNERGWWYQYADGSYPCDTTVEIDGVACSFDENGYWIDPNAPTGAWIHGAGGWWYQYADGSYPCDTTVEIDGVACSFDENGYWIDPNAPTGVWILGARGWWYRFNDGSYPASAWLELKGVWYYFDAEGYMVTGWQVIGGWWYYFYDDGAMAHDTVVDGYTLSASGAWV